jgi:hypothetical protein
LRIFTQGKSKIPSQSTLGHVVPFVANLRDNAVATHPTCVVGPCRRTIPLDVKRALTNNRNDAERCLHSMRILGRTRRSREDGFERLAMRITKNLKKVASPIVEGRKTKMLAEIDGSESDSDINDDGLSGRNDDTSHVELLNDSTYSEGDE